MTERIPVKDNTTGVTTWMWTVDAEEAVRNDATGVRFTPTPVGGKATIPLPKKNPGGKGF